MKNDQQVALLFGGQADFLEADILVQAHPVGRAHGRGTSASLRAHLGSDAPRGIGKTHVSLMIAYAVATGGSVFNGKWQTNTPRKVLFVDGEMPLVVMQERLAKIVNSYGS